MYLFERDINNPNKCKCIDRINSPHFKICSSRKSLLIPNKSTKDHIIPRNIFNNNSLDIPDLEIALPEDNSDNIINQFTKPISPIHNKINNVIYQHKPQLKSDYEIFIEMNGELIHDSDISLKKCSVNSNRCEIDFYGSDADNWESCTIEQIDSKGNIVYIDYEDGKVFFKKK